MLAEGRLIRCHRANVDFTNSDEAAYLIVEAALFCIVRLDTVRACLALAFSSLPCLGLCFICPVRSLILLHVVLVHVHIAVLRCGPPLLAVPVPFGLHQHLIIIRTERFPLRSVRLLELTSCASRVGLVLVWLYSAFFDSSASARFGSSDSLAFARFFSARSCSALSSSRFVFVLIQVPSGSLLLCSPVSVRPIRLALTRFFSSRFARTRFRFGSLPGRPILLAADHGSYYFARCGSSDSLASIRFDLFLFIRFVSHWLVRFWLVHSASPLQIFRFRLPLRLA